MAKPTTDELLTEIRDLLLRIADRQDIPQACTHPTTNEILAHIARRLDGR